MMIRYVRERGYEGTSRDPLLTIANVYVVLGVVFRPAPYAVQVCICTDSGNEDDSTAKSYSDGGPGVFDMKLFDVVDPRVPPDWLMSDHGRGYYSLDPTEFAGDFWDRFHEADVDAERTFGRVLEKIEAFHAKPASTPTTEG